jgi:hypothetical protein
MAVYKHTNGKILRAGTGLAGSPNCCCGPKIPPSEGCCGERLVTELPVSVTYYRWLGPMPLVRGPVFNEPLRPPPDFPGTSRTLHAYTTLNAKMTIESVIGNNLIPNIISISGTIVMPLQGASSEEGTMRELIISLTCPSIVPPNPPVFGVLVPTSGGSNPAFAAGGYATIISCNPFFARTIPSYEWFPPTGPGAYNYVDNDGLEIIEL